MTLRTYVARRLVLLIPTFFFVSLLIFALSNMAPGHPLDHVMIGPPVDREFLEQIRQELGLDQPILVQYLLWVGRLLRGDLGYSYASNRPVWELIATRILPTVELVLLAEVVSVAFAIVVGVVAAVKNHSTADALASHWALISYSAPGFWIGLIALLMFSGRGWLGWFPPEGAGGYDSSLSASRFILPTIVLASGWTAYLFRMVKSSMLEVLKQDYLTAARAKGLGERVVIYKHALSNALLPIVKHLGCSMGFLFGGAVVIEYIFAWPGLGDLFVRATHMRDYPALLGLSMTIAIMFIIVNTCTDIAYAVANPQTRREPN